MYIYMFIIYVYIYIYTCVYVTRAFNTRLAIFTVNNSVWSKLQLRIEYMRIIIARLGPG